MIGSERDKGLEWRAMFPFCFEMDSLILSEKRDVVLVNAESNNMTWSQTKTLLLASLLGALLNPCNAAEPGKEIAPGVRLSAYIRDPRIKESSGVVASRRHSVYWTHNDGGGPKKQIL